MHTPLAHCQRGAISAIVAAGIAFVLLLAVAVAHRNVLVEQRIAANQQRATQAFEAAEAGIAWTLARLADAGRVGADCRAAGATSFAERFASPAGLAAARSPACVRDGSTWRCACPPDGDPATLAGSGDVATAFRITLQAGAVAGQLRVRSQGCAGTLDACDALARSEATIAWLAPVARLPAAALTARGRIEAGTQPIGAHHADAASGGLTLHAGAAIDATAARLTPPAGSLRESSVVATDATLAAATADDAFARRFGLPRAAVRRLASRLACTDPDCTPALRRHLQGSNAQTVWIDGDANFETALDVGTPQRPVLLIVDGALRIRGDVAIHGLVHAARLEWSAGSGPVARVHGAAIVDGDAVLSGSVDFIHDATLLARLQQQAAAPTLVPGSWRDY